MIRGKRLDLSQQAHAFHPAELINTISQTLKYLFRRIVTRKKKTPSQINGKTVRRDTFDPLFLLQLLFGRSLEY